jgi:hypothetical protein
MRCVLYSAAGRLLRAGLGGVRRGGTVVLAAERAAEPVPVDGTPLVLEEGRRRFPVRVVRVHPPADAELAARYEVYHLTPIPAATDAEADGRSTR